MSVKPERLLGDIKTADVFHHPVKPKNLNFNTFTFYIINQVPVFYFPKLLLIFQIFDIKSDLRVSKKPKHQIFTLNFIAMRDRRHTNRRKQTKSLADNDVAPPIGLAYGHVISQCFHQEIEHQV